MEKIGQKSVTEGKSWATPQAETGRCSGAGV